MTADMQRYLDVALEAVAQAREVLLAHRGAAPALFKGEGDFATEADLAIEALLREHLRRETLSLIHI